MEQLKQIILDVLNDTADSGQMPQHIQKATKLRHKFIAEKIVSRVELLVIPKNSGQLLSWRKPSRKPELQSRIFILADGHIYTGFTQYSEQEKRIKWLEDSMITEIKEQDIKLWAYQPEVEKTLAVFSV